MRLQWTAGARRHCCSVHRPPAAEAAAVQCAGHRPQRRLTGRPRPGPRTLLSAALYRTQFCFALRDAAGESKVAGYQPTPHGEDLGGGRIGAPAYQPAGCGLTAHNAGRQPSWDVDMRQPQPTRLQWTAGASTALHGEPCRHVCCGQECPRSQLGRRCERTGGAKKCRGDAVEAPAVPGGPASCLRTGVSAVPGCSGSGPRGCSEPAYLSIARSASRQRWTASRGG